MSHDTLASRSIELVRTWTERSRNDPGSSDPAAARLADLLKDPAGLDFTISFVDRVVRPEDHRVAAHNLRRLARRTPRFLPRWQRVLLKIGAVVSVLLPRVVVASARRTLRHLVGHLVVDARPKPLGRAIQRLRGKGDRLNINLLGEAVLGEGEAERRRDHTIAILERDDVDYVSVKVSAVASQLSMWAFDETVDRVVERLRPLYDVAARDGSFINLDMEEYRDLDLTVAVFTTILEEYPDLEAGIVLQAYLPDALGAIQRLQDWASARRAAGGARVKVRVVKGANLAMERVDAVMHDWPLATWESKRATDTNYKRVLNWALTPERVDAMRIGVAGQNLFDIAWAWLLAGDRAVRDAVDFEMLLGMDTGPTAVVRDEVGALLLYTPVVRPSEFDVAISYLVRRLEENASSENFMSAAFDLTDSESAFDREAGRFLASLEAIDDDTPSPNRNQDRSTERVRFPRAGFDNTADTDPSTAPNRDWGRAALAASSDSRLGLDILAENAVDGTEAMQALVRETTTAGQAWGRRPAAERAEILVAAAEELASRRGDLVTVAAAETGKVIGESDVEVSEAIDFARYYAQQARELERVEGARFTPAQLTVVTPPWNFPIAIPTGSMLSALAAGSAVIVKPAPQSMRCCAVVVSALWDAGIPRDVLRLASMEEGDVSAAMVAHPAVDQVILTGGWETARLFRSWRPDLPLRAETSGKNALVVTPSADLDLAVADLAKSAFGNAGQKCSAASLAILVGSVGRSERFERQLVDAVSTMVVGWPDNPDVAMGPVVEQPGEKLREGLSTLGRGERWLLEPRPLDDSGRLWSPGIRTGVRPGSEYHLTEYFGPVLGLMNADDLDEAIVWQNATDFGLTAGIHSLDPDEVNTWLDRVEAGNLYVNRGITGAIVRRQPFGGWKRSVVGPTMKAGGPNYLLGMGRWSPAPFTDDIEPVGLHDDVVRMLESVRPALASDEYLRLRAAAMSDQRAWAQEFGVLRDVSGLGVERNVFRYRAVPGVMVRGSGSLVDLTRVLLAARRVGADITVSSASVLPDGLAPGYRVETDQAWLKSVAESRPDRIRLVGGDVLAVAQAVGGDPDVAVYGDQVTPAGRIEGLPFLREQAISITTHRFGNHDPAFDRVLPEEG